MVKDQVQERIMVLFYIEVNLKYFLFQGKCLYLVDMMDKVGLMISIL